MIPRLHHKKLLLLPLAVILAACSPSSLADLHNFLQMPDHATNMQNNGSDPMGGVAGGQMPCAQMPCGPMSGGQMSGDHQDDHSHAAATADAMSGMGGMGGMAMAPDPSTVGDPVKGKALFNQGFGSPTAPACATCHYDDRNEVKVGPSLVGIAMHGMMHAQANGEDLVTFLRQSIVEPNKDLMEAPGHVFSVNGVSLMYQNYGKDLTKEQIDNLVAYLLTLK